MTTTMQLLKEVLEEKLKNTVEGETISVLMSRHAAISLLMELEFSLNTEDDKNG